MNLGGSIKKVRLQKNLKQNEFATKCGITQAYLSQVENNLREPNLSTLKIIANNLDVPLPILFFLSLELSDVDINKQEAYSLLVPPVKSLINQFFGNEDSD